MSARSPGKCEALCDGQDGGYHHCSDADRCALKGIVEIFAMGGDAVSDRGACCIQCAGMTDCRAGAVAVPACNDLLDVVFTPCRNR